MELRTIRYFVAVADAGSVTGATKVLHLSQPSLSRQLRQLEKELGLELFTRRDGRLVLTPGGQQFLPAARDLLSRADAAKAAAAGIRVGALPTITVAAPTVTLNDVLAPFFATFTPDDPLPRVFDLDPRNEFGALDRGADLVIGTRPPGPGLATAPIARLLVFAYVRADHPLAERGAVSVQELAAHHLLVLPAEDSHARRSLDAAFDADQVPHGSLTEFSSSQVAQAVAASGRGVAVVSDDPRFGLRPLPIRGSGGTVTISLHAGWLPHHHGAAQLRELATRLAAFTAARYGSVGV
jgi:DNA-binding transcriptional LysR family regulator